MVKISIFKYFNSCIYIFKDRHRKNEALVTAWSTCKERNKRTNKKHILHIIRVTNCRNIYVIIHVLTSKWINSKTKQINSSKLYQKISLSKKMLNCSKIIEQNSSS